MSIMHLNVGKQFFRCLFLVMATVLSPGRRGSWEFLVSLREVWDLESWKVAEGGEWVCEIIASDCKFIS